MLIITKLLALVLFFVSSAHALTKSGLSLQAVFDQGRILSGEDLIPPGGKVSSESLADWVPLTWKDLKFPYGEANTLEIIPEWKSIVQLEEAFELIRDYRYFKAQREPYARRIAWLYPEGGRCLFRALAVDAILKENGFPPVGSLYLDTRGGGVGGCSFWKSAEEKDCMFWGWHTVPVAKIRMAGRDEVYVFDVSYYAEGPIRLHDWLKLNYKSSASTETEFLFMVQKPYTDRFSKDYQEELFKIYERKDTVSEYDKVRNRGYDPMRILGDEPPWMSPR